MFFWVGFTSSFIQDSFWWNRHCWEHCWSLWLKGKNRSHKLFTAFKFTLTAGALISLARGYPLITSIVRDLEKYNHTKCLEEGEYLVDSNNGYYCFPLWAKDSLFPLFTPYGTYLFYPKRNWLKLNSFPIATWKASCMDDVRWFLHWGRCAVTSVSASNVVSLDSETYKLKRLVLLPLPPNSSS